MPFSIIIGGKTFANRFVRRFVDYQRIDIILIVVPAIISAYAIRNYHRPFTRIHIATCYRIGIALSGEHEVKERLGSEDSVVANITRHLWQLFFGNIAA